MKSVLIKSPHKKKSVLIVSRLYLWNLCTEFLHIVGKTSRLNIIDIKIYEDQMTSQAISTPPSVSWAQRSSCVFLTFNVECEKPDIKIEKQLVSFKGLCAPNQKLHEVEIPLLAEINPEKSSHVNKGRYIKVVLAKTKTDEVYWPSLTNDKKKHHWLKVDFNRWQDENESGDEIEDMNDMFSSKIGDFGDENDNEDSSSEEEDLPDLE